MIEIRIKSTGGWLATIRDGQSRSHSIYGFGDGLIPITCDSGSVYSIAVQNLGRAPSTLVIEVIKNGVIYQKSSTSSAGNRVISMSGTC